MPRNFYIPALGDLVVGVVVKRTGEFYKVDVGAARDGLLPMTAFNGATKQNAPSLEVGAIVLAGVANADVEHELMLSCVAADEVKSWSSRECYLGALVKGLMFKLPLHICEILLETDNSLLHLLGEKMPYEIAVGQNGYCWLKAGSVRNTILGQQIIEKCLLDSGELQSFADLEEFFEKSPLVTSLSQALSN